MRCIRTAQSSDFITKYLPEKARTAFFAAKQAEHDRIALADDRTAAERSSILNATNPT